MARNKTRIEKWPGVSHLSWTAADSFRSPSSAELNEMERNWYRQRIDMNQCPHQDATSRETWLNNQINYHIRNARKNR